MWNTASSLSLLVGRLLLSGIFIMSGAMKFMKWDETQASMEAEGMIAVPFFLLAAALVEVVAGMGILIGFKTTWSALALAAFLVPVTFIFHDFWKYEGAAQMNQMQHFMKNFTILGGLLTLAAAGAGRFAIDALVPAGGVERWGVAQRTHGAMSS